MFGEEVREWKCGLDVDVMDTHSGYDQAAQRVNEKVGFHTHLVAYVAVNALLAAIDFA